MSPAETIIILQLTPHLQMALSGIKIEWLQPGLGVPSQQILCYKSTPSSHNNRTTTTAS